MRDISASALKKRQAVIKAAREKLSGLSPEQQLARQRELHSTFAQQAGAVRKQIEELLTAEQLRSLRMLALGSRGTLALTEEQRKDLEKRTLENETWRQLKRSSNKIEEEILAVFTPKQRDEIVRISGGIAANMSYPCSELEALTDPAVIKQMALNAEQDANLKAILAASQSRGKEISKHGESINSPIPVSDREAEIMALQRMIQQANKEDRQQITALLTQQQLAQLHKILAERDFYSLLLMSGVFENSGVGQQHGILDRVGATKEQTLELRRLHNEQETLVRHVHRVMGKILEKMLSPQQQDKVLDELDQRQP